MGKTQSLFAHRQESNPYMHVTEYPNAWDHPLTRAAWVRHMLMNVASQIFWIAAFPGSLYAMVVFTSSAYVIAFAPFMLYSMYRAFIQMGYFPWALRMRRILREYPWQVLQGVPRSLARHPEASDEGAWLEFVNPVNAEQRIPMVFIRHQRAHWWLKRIRHNRTKRELKAQIEPLWFAGDPRFLGVIAAADRVGTSPRRLHVLYQRSVFDSRRVAVTWDADAEDLQRARRAGALNLGSAVQSQA